MLDEGGDGLCCDYGRGFFVLMRDGETIVNSDGEFGGGEFHGVYVGGTARSSSLRAMMGDEREKTLCRCWIIEYSVERF